MIPSISMIFSSEMSTGHLGDTNRTPLTLEEMLDPVEEQEIGDSMYRFEGRDAEIITAI